MSGIYKIQSKIKPERVYIGNATRLDKRKNDHFRTLKNKTHYNRKLQNHVNKYGLEDLNFKILIICEKGELIRKEQCYLNVFQPYFNICKIAGNTLGVKYNESSKSKMREIWRLRLEEVDGEGKSVYKSKLKKDYLNRNKISPRKRKKHSAETIEKMRIAKLGNKYALGHKHNAITIEKIKESKKHISSETRKKMSESQKKFRRNKILQSQ